MEIRKENIESLDFDKGNGLIPAIIQDQLSGQILMLGYMNHSALERTFDSGRVTFYSRSKQRLWTKGESSGNFLALKHVETDCDHDTLLIRVDPIGPVCHTGSSTCFRDSNEQEFSFLHYLEQIIQNRKSQPSEKSYTSKLFAKGLNKIVQKFGEEAVETLIEAKDENKDLFINESADLLYHFLVLLAAKDIHLNEILDVLKGRHH